MALNLGPRMRLVLRYVGFAVLGLVTFVFALQLTFPYGRVKDKVIDVLSAKYEVTIGDVERGFMPGRVAFKAVTLRTRPTKADDVPTTFFIERLEVDLGLLALVRGAASVDIDAKIGPGHIAGNITISKQATSIDVQGSNLPAAMLPMREGIGLPMSGKVGFSVVLDLPNQKGKQGKVGANWQKATGAIGFDCPSGCTFGDGKAKLKPNLKNARSQAFAGDGIDFGKINVDTMLARVTIKDGQMELTKFDTKSKDGELNVEFSATLAPAFSDSLVAGCLRFKGSPELQEREPKTHAALSTTGAGLGPDGLFHIRLDGKFSQLKKLAQTCGPAIKSVNMDDPGSASGSSARPNLTVQPADPTLTGGSANPPPPPATPTVTPDPIAHDAAVPAVDDKTGAPAAPEEGAANGSAEGSAAPPTPPGEALAPSDIRPGVDGETPQPPN